MHFVCVEDSFFTPHGITSLVTRVTSIYYRFLGKSHLKPKISLYLIQLHGLGSHVPQDPYFKRWIHGPYFLFINWDHNPRHYQHQYMDQVQVMNQNSWPILSLSYSWKVASPTKAHIYIKWQQAQGMSSHLRLMIQAHESLWGNFGRRGLEGQEVCSVKLQRFKVGKRNMLLGVSSLTPWTLMS